MADQEFRNSQVADALREAGEGRYGKNDGWLNVLQIRNVLINSGRWRLETTAWDVRRALRVLPVERKQVRRLTFYRLTDQRS